MLEHPLTERARADREWLEKKLGQRLAAPVREPRIVCGEMVVSWAVPVAKRDGKFVTYYGETLEEIYARIRGEAEADLAAKRRARARA